jgi:ParB family chromosome partitioning protein
MQIWKQLGAVTEDTGVRAYKEARLIDLARIRPNPRQPRKTFDAEALNELAESIREQGLLQPIVVRPDGDEFIIIAGHRRYDACRLIGMEQIPAVIREVGEHEALEQSLIENVQREDINPVEEAQCYRQLMDEHNYSIRDMATKVHKSVGYIHGRLELLKYEDLAQSVSQSEVGVFEARELAKIEDEGTRQELTERVAAGEMDRKTLKHEVKRLTGKLPPPPEPRPELVEGIVEGFIEVPRPEHRPEAPPEFIEGLVEGPVARSEPGRREGPVGGEAEGLVVGQREGRLFLFDLQTFSQSWGQIRDNLQALDTEKLAAEERSKVRQLLEEIKVTIEEMLARIE